MLDCFSTAEETPQNRVSSALDPCFEPQHLFRSSSCFMIPPVEGVEETEAEGARGAWTGYDGTA